MRLYIFRQRCTGFTLIEMMVTIALAVILLAIAAPQFQDLIRSNRITTETNRLLADIRLARSEAMKRGRRVVLCPSASTLSATPGCDGTASVWSDGWLVFADQDDNNTFTSGTDILLRVATQSANGVTIRSNDAAATGLAFNADATTTAGSTARFAFCDQRGNTYGNQINVATVGRPHVTGRASDCTDPTS